MTVDPDTKLKPARAAFADGPRLLADIGATHARFGLETAPGVLSQVSVLRCDDYDGIVPLLHAYLAEHPNQRISHAAFALANPISGDFIRMTNRDWQFSTDEVRRALGLSTLLIVNDFTALAMALPGFQPQDLLQIGGQSQTRVDDLGAEGDELVVPHLECRECIAADAACPRRFQESCALLQHTVVVAEHRSHARSPLNQQLIREASS